MNLLHVLNWLNRHFVTVFLSMMLLGLCAISHIIASSVISAVGGEFQVMNTRTEHNMALINVINSDWWIAVGFGFIFIGSLMFLEFRQSPRWSVWLVFLILAMPCAIYLEICAHIANKIIF